MNVWLRDGDGWRHRPWWKVAINTVLRWFQPQARKWVVYTRTVDPSSPDDPPVVVGYGFGRVLHERHPPPALRYDDVLALVEQARPGWRP